MGRSLSDFTRADLRRLHEAASPEPWTESIVAIDGDSRYAFAGVGPWHKKPRADGCGQDERALAVRDSRLLAAARNALPALLDALDVAEKMAELLKSLRHEQAGDLLCICNYPNKGTPDGESEDVCIATQAGKLLAEWDRVRGKP